MSNAVEKRHFKQTYEKKYMFLKVAVRLSMYSQTEACYITATYFNFIYKSAFNRLLLYYCSNKKAALIYGLNYSFSNLCMTEKHLT